VKSSYTDLQKKEAWKLYNGKKVLWSGTVTSVSDTFGLTLQVKMRPTTFTSDLLISLEDAERSKALQLSEGQHVTFTGVLHDWGTLMPISLKHGQIIN
jgi:hypothetical protein